MIYATAAEGYRIGGANESLAGVAACVPDLAAIHKTDVPHTFNSDSLWSYELGDKGSFLGGRLRVDASIYWINWQNIQEQVLLPDCGYYYTGNLGAAESRGFDIQADYSVGSGLEIGGSAGLTDARYTSNSLLVPSLGVVKGNVLSLSGDSLATPEWTATTFAEQAFDLPRKANGYARVDYQFSGPYYRTGSYLTYSYNTNTRDAPATNFLSLRAGRP